tara:strand:+ start:50 stop:265 length:216 start_codon:yes stop_codon:yes gene_type:complete
MNIRDLVGKIEEIERESTGKARDMCWDLINELIEIDLEMEKGMKNFNRKVEKDFVEFLMTEGIKSGSIGEA